MKRRPAPGRPNPRRSHAAHPLPKGRRQAFALASMNLRAIVGLIDLTYLAPSPSKLVPVTTAVGPRFQPRDERGRFVAYADLWNAVNVEYAMTAYAYDEIDRLDGLLETD